MIEGGLLAGLRTAAPARGLRSIRKRLTKQADGAPPGGSAPGRDDRDSAERIRLRRKAAVHGQLAIQISELMKGNVARREDKLERLAGLEFPGARTADDPAADQASAIASLRDEIEALDRIITQQIKTIDGHLQEARRLRDQATQA